MAISIRESKAAKRKKGLGGKIFQQVKMTDEEIDELAQTGDIRLLISEILKYILK